MIIKKRDFKLTENEIHSFTKKIGDDELWVRILGSGNTRYLTSVIFAHREKFALSLGVNEAMVNSIKSFDEAVEIANELVNKMLNDRYFFYHIMDKYEIHYK